LQHTHVVPLFCEQTFKDRGLRALCMPYLGGATLARMLQELREIAPGERTGRHLLEALDRAGGTRAGVPEREGPCRRYLEDASYVEAACWIGLCLAKALHCAHQHGLVHMDVKPSNVLLAADGLPMLLDFHLARRRIERNEGVLDRLGGTPDWMAPEHRAALDAVQLGQPVSEPVDGRADLYALGLLLREALVGSGTGNDPIASVPWQRRNRHISIGLAAIVAKCLAERPADRYRDAEELAEDLRRHLNDLPLRGVPNRSLAEAWRKWRRRRPAALSKAAAWFSVALAVLMVSAAALAYIRQRVSDIDTALADGTKLSASGRFPEAVQTLTRGLTRARGIPGIAPLRSALQEQRLRALRGEKALELHALADVIRFRYGVAPPPASEARSVMRSIQSVWDQRGILLGAVSPRLAAAIEEGIQADFTELAILWAELRAALHAPGEPEAARREALQVLEDARLACGSSPALERCRRAIAAEPATTSLEKAPAVSTGPDHYDSGRAYLRAGRYREAGAEFQTSLQDHPSDFWSHFYQGVCAFRLQHFWDALAAFRTCIALAPRSAECYYNRALAAEALGRAEDAFRDYSKALELDPHLSAAALNRGILSHKGGRPDRAISDFERALNGLSDQESIGRAYYNLALAHSANGDAAAALRCSDEALAHEYAPAGPLRKRLLNIRH
jgi:eukaryotic-like serine/threonine-protein kinase